MSEDSLCKLIDELKENGVSAEVSELKGGKNGEIQKVLEISVKLDFSEHDKVFEDKIAELKKDFKAASGLLSDYRQENESLKQRIAELESKETKKPTKINLNDRIKVKLTPLGVEIYYHQYDELNKWIKERGGKQLEPRMPEIDKDGYTKFTLWNFMELYGEHIGMCKPSVISPLYIELCQDEWKMRYNEEPIEKGKE